MAKETLFAAPTAYLEVSVKQACELRLRGLPPAGYGFVCKTCGEPVVPVEHPEYGDHFRHVESGRCLGRYLPESEPDGAQD